MKKLLLTIVLAIYLYVSYEMHEHYTNGLYVTTTENIDLHLHNLRKEDIDKMIGNFDHVTGITGM